MGEPPGIVIEARDPRPLPTIIAELNKARSSGILVVTNREGRRELIFTDGEVRAARSNIESEKLGSWLVSRKVISIQDKALGLMTQGSSASPFGHVLVTRGVIDQPTLERQLQDLALAIIELATVQMRNRIDFAKDSAGGQLDTLPNITTPQLILLAARSYPQIEIKRDLVGDHDQQAWLARALPTVLHDLELSEEERQVLNCLQQPLTLKELRAATGLAEDPFVATVYTLMTAGTIAVGAAGAPDVETLPLGQTSPAVAADASEPDLDPDLVRERDLVLRAVGFTAQRSHYENLGLEPSAGEEQVRESWARLQKIFHPRRAAEIHLSDLSPQLTIVYERLRDAFQTLSDQASRRHYDQSSGIHPAPVPEPSITPSEAEIAGVPQKTSRIGVARAHVTQAEAALLEGDVFTAHSLLEVACDLDPQPEPMLKLARLMLFNPNLAEPALERLRLVLELSPRYTDAWLALADFWRRRDHRERERKALERALAIEPGRTSTVDRYRELVGDEQVERFLARARGH